MVTQLSAQDLASLYQDGFVNLKNFLDNTVMDQVQAAASRLRKNYVYGFDHSGGFGAPIMATRKTAPLPTGRAPTIIYHNAGFLEPDLLLPLLNPAIHDLIERIVGADFYLSNVWLQVVPPGTGRMGYHKDEHGSVSITMPLDPIGWNSGSTCLVPKTHRHTPPPNFCMGDIMQQHPDEAQLTGTSGDVIFFTPEAWHGRSANASSLSTCRLFFNFYSRSSRDETRWSPCIMSSAVLDVAEILPAQFRHMLRLGRAVPEPEYSMVPAAQSGKFQTWVMHNGSSSSSADLASVVREYFYWKFSLCTPVGSDARQRLLPPYRTTITETDQFSLLTYLTYLNGTRTLKNIVRLTLQYWTTALKMKNSAIVKGGE